MVSRVQRGRRQRSSDEGGGRGLYGASPVSLSVLPSFLFFFPFFPLPGTLGAASAALPLLLLLASHEQVDAPACARPACSSPPAGDVMAVRALDLPAGPSPLVQAWRATACMKGLDWSSLRCYRWAGGALHQGSGLCTQRGGHGGHSSSAQSVRGCAPPCSSQRGASSAGPLSCGGASAAVLSLPCILHLVPSLPPLSACPPAFSCTVLLHGTACRSNDSCAMAAARVFWLHGQRRVCTPGSYPCLTPPPPPHTHTPPHTAPLQLHWRGLCP